ncbi:MAG: LysM peptidoglycan-binding domain-containing protein [Promethearchaeati archaeon SRVP18_Atabeyarchaeia-1]
MASGKLSEEYGIDKRTLRRGLVKLIGEREYKGIMDRNVKQRKKQVPLEWALRRLRNAELLTKLSNEYGVSRKTLRSAFRLLIGEGEYSAIIDRKARKQVPIKKVLRRFKSGETLKSLCMEYHVTWETLRNILTKAIGEEEYRKLVPMHRGGRARRQLPVQEVLTRVKAGQSLGRLAKAYNVSWLTLKRRLVELVGKDGYKSARKRTTRIRVKPRRATVGYGSPLAKENGADSLIELKVRMLLQNNRVSFGYRESLVVRGHCYEPDFMFGDRTIVEVMGVTNTEYWTRCHKKL